MREEAGRVLLLGSYSKSCCLLGIQGRDSAAGSSASVQTCEAPEDPAETSNAVDLLWLRQPRADRKRNRAELLQRPSQLRVATSSEEPGFDFSHSNRWMLEMAD